MKNQDDESWLTQVQTANASRRQQAALNTYNRGRHHMRDIGQIADAAAKAYAEGDKDLAAQLLGRAVKLADPSLARMAFVKALAVRAGQARRDGEHGVVSRLTQASYACAPDTVPNSVVRQLLVNAGAAGYLPRQPDPRPRQRMFMLVQTEA